MLTEVFKAGTHIDARGVSREFTEEHLEQIADYDRDRHRAPWLQFHKPGLGTFGQVKRIVKIGSKLFAEFFKVRPEFAQEVNKGFWPGLSIGLYAPDDPINPKPGFWQLQEISSLSIPSVKGMKEPFVPEEAIAYAENPQAVWIQYGDIDYTPAIATFARGVRELLLSQYGAETVDRYLPGWMIDAIFYEAIADKDDDDEDESDVPTAMPPALPPIYSEGEKRMTEEELKKAQDALTERENAFKAQEAVFARKEADLKARTEFSEWIEPLISDGKVLPREKQKHVAALIAASHSENKVQFGEGDGESTSLVEYLKGLIASGAKQIQYNEQGKPKYNQDGGGVHFAAPKGTVIEPTALEVHRKATAYAEAHKVPYQEALEAVYN